MESLLGEALEYAKLGLPVFPLSPLTKIPRKGSNGFKDATTDVETIVSWFTDIEPLANIGIRLEETDYFVVDCDRHKEEQDGIQSLIQLSQGKALPDKLVAVKTPSNEGKHLWFKKPKGIEIKHQTDFRDGLDILSFWVMAPKSRIRSEGTIKEYELIAGNLDNIPNAPSWLIQAITGEQQGNESFNGLTANFSDVARPKTYYTAKFMTTLLNGTAEGNRDNWLTEQFGRMIGLGFDYTAAYEWIQVINEKFVSPPISDKQLNKIVLSITKKEQRKLEERRE